LQTGWIVLAGLSGFVAVAAGAFGAHALQDRLSREMLSVYELGVRYHFGHTLALLLIGVLRRDGGRRGYDVSGWCFLLGIAIFSGSLYALALSGQRWLGAITPIGGAALLAGWAALAITAYRIRPGR
jgi:uncharacterized membrane protein YgdD (TMEM256/DUF423 family)